MNTKKLVTQDEVLELYSEIFKRRIFISENTHHLNEKSRSDDSNKNMAINFVKYHIHKSRCDRNKVENFITKQNIVKMKPKKIEEQKAFIERKRYEIQRLPQFNSLEEQSQNLLYKLKMRGYQINN